LGPPVVYCPMTATARRDDPDQQLVEKAREGSSRARARLFQRNWDAAWARAYAVTGRREMAEDVTQDAFERAFAALEGFDGRAAFRTWLLRIVTNRALDVVKREARVVPLDSIAEPAVDWVDASGDRGAMQQAVATLPTDRRVVVVMRYWLDMPVTEIAASLSVPEGTVHSRLARALDDLRSHLGAHDAI
jgi:RNA polymerase sigma-70 factor, ECF subfamily